MFKRATTVLFFALISAASARAEDECVFRKVVALPTPPQPNGDLLIPAELGGHPTHLVLDTGGAWSLIDEELAKTLGAPLRTLPVDEGTFRDAAGNRIDRYVAVPTMKVGPIAINQPVDFLVVQHEPGRPTEEFGGSLGINFLSKFDVDIDNAKHVVTLFLPAPVAACGVYWAKDFTSFPFSLHGGNPLTRAVVDGETVDAVIDTGSPRTILDVNFARRHFNLTPASPGVTDNGLQMLPGGKATKFYGASVNVLEVSGIRFDNVPVELAELEGARLILGMNELKRLHLYFNFKGRTIYATAADGGTAPPPPDAREH